MTAAALGCVGQALEAPANHGTHIAYRHCPDRCQPCRDAWAAHRRTVRAGLAVPPAAQPCGHCGRPVPWRKGRIAGRTWWHGGWECQDGREQARAEAKRRRAGQPPRPASPCEHCGRPYYRTVGSTSPWRLCSRRGCKVEKNRRLRARLRARKREQAALAVEAAPRRAALVAELRAASASGLRVARSPRGEIRAEVA